MGDTYKIVRRYRDKHTKRALHVGLTLEEAQAWCQDPETSSRTCTKPAGKACTRRNGPWFDGYEKE